MVGANRQVGTAEHGLGAGLVKILASPGPRPSKRVMRQTSSAKQGGTASILSSLSYAQGRFYFYW